MNLQSIKQYTSEIINNYFPKSDFKKGTLVDFCDEKRIYLCDQEQGKLFVKKYNGSCTVKKHYRLFNWYSICRKENGKEENYLVSRSIIQKTK